VSRTTRVGTVDGFWVTVDEWAADVVEPSRVRAWWTSRARLEATCGPYLDVIGDPALLGGRLTPLNNAVANRGVALADADDLRAALADAGVEHRVVEAARRYRWNGPMLTPVALELHTSGAEAVVQAWWEDVWAAWPTIRLGRESTAQRPPRRATPVAQITRLFAALGHEPLSRQD
jgi:hypothetical protein